MLKNCTFVQAHHKHTVGSRRKKKKKNIKLLQVSYNHRGMFNATDPEQRPCMWIPTHRKRPSWLLQKMGVPGSSAWHSVITAGCSHNEPRWRLFRTSSNTFLIRAEKHVCKHVISCSHMERKTMLKQHVCSLWHT